MFRLLKFALVLVPLLTIEVTAQQNFDLVGSYLFSFQWGGGRVTLKKNGTFTAESGACTSVSTESGPYFIANGVVHFRTVKLTMRSFDDNKEHDLTKLKARKKYLDTSEPFQPSSWELQIIRWGDRVYLVNDKNFDNFIEAINLGLEPRFVDSHHAYYGLIYLREGDEHKAVTGLPSLPGGFLKDLLPTPVVATILEISVSGDLTLATIDRGSVDGLKPEMTLVAVGSREVYERYYIESVTDRTAKVRVYGDVKKGDQLTTRATDPTRLF